MNSRIEIRLTAEEKKELIKRADECGLSLSSYLRKSGVSAKIINNSAKREQLKRTNVWLGRICGNIHALAKYANYQKHHVQGAVILKRLDEIQSLVLGIGHD